jgi:hypothetical protein
MHGKPSMRLNCHNPLLATHSNFVRVWQYYLHYLKENSSMVKLPLSSLKIKGKPAWLKRTITCETSIPHPRV